MSSPEEIDQALAIADKLEEGGACYWGTVTWQELRNSLRLRIRRPELIRQAQTPNCGPAALAYTLASDHPAVYAQAVFDLYRKGRAVLPGPMTDGAVLEPSYELRMLDYNQMYGATTTAESPAADWILLSSIRNNTVWWGRFIGGWPVLGMVVDGAMPSTVEKWFKGLGYTGTKNETNLFFTQELYNLRWASDLVDHGWKVILCINSKLLYPDKRNSGSICPDHYVALTGKLRYATPDEQFFSIDLFTYGKIKTIPENPSEAIQWKTFRKNYYGFVAARH
jgi:hypothetical protein